MDSAEIRKEFIKRINKGVNTNTQKAYDEHKRRVNQKILEHKYGGHSSKEEEGERFDGR